MKFDYTQLENKLKEMPHVIQVALTSRTIGDEIQKIANENDLLLDQTGVLFDLTTYVLLGLLPSADYVKTLKEDTNITNEKASKIAKEVNERVIQTIRKSLQENQVEPEEQSTEEDIASLEQAGGFAVERVDNESNQAKISGRDREQIISSIENPEPIKETRFPKNEILKEPLVDQLLNSATSRPSVSENVTPPEHHTGMPPANLPTAENVSGNQPMTKIEPNTPPTPPKPVETPKKSGPDVYRESVS